MFQSPLRIEWDLPSREEDILTVGRKILGGGIFQLTLYGFEKAKEEVVIQLLEELAGNKIKIFLVSDTFDFKECHGIIDKIAGIIFEPQEDGFSIIDESVFSIPKERKAVSIYLTKKNLENIPTLIDLAISKSVGGFIVNNFNFWEVAERDIVFSIDRERFLKLKREVEKKLSFWKDKIKLVIKDYLLWPIFYPVVGQGSEVKGLYHGCQAGSTLAYIRNNGKVYGCSALPLELGNIYETSLREIWQKSAGDLNKLVSELPRKCVSCSRIDWCKGGCRGRSYCCYKNFEHPDPVCPKKLMS